MRAVLFLLAVLGAAKAWHPTGHFLVALIAQIELQRDNPELFDKLEEIVGVLSPFTAENEHKFVECAEFPDDIKYQNWKAFDSWHFSDHYIFSGVDPKPMPDNKENMMWAMLKAIRNLNTNKPSKINQMLGKSFSLRYLIHLVGDIHQPLHNTSRVTPNFPKGDLGGNLFKIKFPGVYDLHTFWDMCLKKYDEVRTPLDQDKFDYLLNIAKELMEEFPRNKFRDRLADTKFENWSLEGSALAEKVAYDSIEPYTTPSQEYIDRGFAVVKEQLALGGYRLTDVLSKLKIENSSIISLEDK